jgi:glycosyltransferase involved in cell wall biosynthesis
MVPQADGAGAIPELLDAKLRGLLEAHDVTLVGTFGDLAGQAEAADELSRAGLDVHFADRRRSHSGARRWQVRAELAARWARGRWPWRTVSAVGGLQPVLDRVGSTRTFEVVDVEDSPMSVLDLPGGVPSVLTEHEAFRAPAPGWRAPRPAEQPTHLLRALDRRRWERFQRAAWDRADLLQVFSRSDAEAIEARAPDARPLIRVNPFGIALPEAANPGREVPGTLLFAGTFTHEPNREAALWLGREIMPAVVARSPEARLRIVGTVPPPEVRALAGPHVEVVADAPSMRPHLEAASVVLAPVRSGGGMRMKVLQGMAAGKPVVTTGRGLEGFDVIDPAPPLVVAESAEEIAAAAAGLLESSERRRELGTEARRFAEQHHTPAAWAERLTAVYEEAVDRSPRTRR